MKEAITLLNRHMANQLKSPSKQIADIAQLYLRTRPEPPPLAPAPFIPIHTDIPPSPPPAPPVIHTDISEDPKKDSYVKGNEPFNNKGTSNQPLNASQHRNEAEDIEDGTPPPTPKAESNPGKSITKGHGKFAKPTSTKETASRKQSQGKARIELKQSQEVEVMSQCTVKDPHDQSQNICDPIKPTYNVSDETERREVDPDIHMINNTDDCQLDKPERINAFLAQDTVEAKVIAAMVEKQASAQKGVIKHVGAYRGPPKRAEGIIGTRQPTPPHQPDGRSSVKYTRRTTPPHMEHTRQITLPRQTTLPYHPGTGANATPISNRRLSRQLIPGTGANASPIPPATGKTTPTEHLMDGKPGRIQRT
ncbi:hypothetical protein L211DRAFT_849558 [Terfezia boudieri ATCC MYA-4762]|uniref:Uncharacterized protein n=1 Tax=Terfezia boudieri ATCC MYA-4762 TaxID=1051890 RepID=A0A3N4LQN2_9PEZI|nr:hypothetical protein L211DRAFT_849558 [Terfezia boudieri ATCC MYA-4762]